LKLLIIIDNNLKILHICKWFKKIKHILKIIPYIQNANTDIGENFKYLRLFLLELQLIKKTNFSKNCILHKNPRFPLLHFFIRLFKKYIELSLFFFPKIQLHTIGYLYKSP